MPRSQYKSYKEILSFARGLRNNQTESEKEVWEMVRKRNISGYRFLRQHPVFYREMKSWTDFYIADFYCRELSLIIEVDGPIHQFNVEYDKDRDSKLKEKGLIVCRITNEQTLNKATLEDIIEGIILNRVKTLKNKQ